MSELFHSAFEQTGFELKPQNPRIKAVLKYIDEHIHEDITMENLMEVSGYAYHYFCHQFKEGTGFSPNNYIIQRKVHMAIQLMQNGHSHLETAKLCGYNNSAELSRVFKKIYGITITQYLRTHPKEAPKPVFKKLEARTVVGYKFDMPDDEDFKILENGAFWNYQTFDPALATVYNAFNPVEHGECGLWVPAYYCGNEAPFYLYGTPVEYANLIPAGLAAARIKSGEYAIFKIENYGVFADLSNNFRKMYQYVMNEWLQEANCYLDSSTPIVEYYRGSDSYLCVPILK